MRHGKAWICLGLMTLSACGGKEEKKDSGPATVYSTLVTVNAPKVDDVGDGKSELTRVDQCTNQADTGFFQAAFSAGDGKPTISIKIKGFETKSKTYTCSQAGDNKSGAVGGKFDGCAVEVQTLYSSSKQTLNKYTMYRDSESMKAMDYTGKCEISATYDAPRVKATINCAKLIQTRLDSMDRNPIDNSVTVDLGEGTTFYCDL